MMKKFYQKLVRDRIPEIIESSGNNCVAEILSDEDYLKMLDAKLDEELAEYHADQNIEELADLMEVIRACAMARGYTIEELERVRSDKAAKRGGFEKKILLKEAGRDPAINALLRSSYLDKHGRRDICDHRFPRTLQQRRLQETVSALDLWRGWICPQGGRPGTALPGADGGQYPILD